MNELQTIDLRLFDAAEGAGADPSVACGDSLRPALPHLPFPGLLRDGPPTARLRKLRAAFFCHRQRQAPRPDFCQY